MASTNLLATPSPSKGLFRSPRTGRQAGMGSTSSPLAGRKLTQASGPSPAYTTNLRSRHSLYGTEDRVILDLGSRIWKAGFSSETRPRVVISVSELCSPVIPDGQSLWNLESPVEMSIAVDAIATGLRRIFFDYLMIDPKQRKVLLIEHALIPAEIRSHIAIVLFDQLHIPSISFTPSSVLVLMASGVVTGLVVDVGHLETIVTPVYLSRPLFPLVKSTTRASSRLSSRLQVLIARFAHFIPTPKFGQSSLSSSGARLPRIGPVPINLLTSNVVEDIKARVLFVAPNTLSTLSHSDPGTSSPVPSAEYNESDNSRLLEAIQRNYTGSTSAGTRDIIYRLPALQKSNIRSPSVGVLRIPGWIRERASEILFHPSLSKDYAVPEEEEESPSIPETILESLLHLPIDLRKIIAANIVICGGGAMLPGFVTRLRSELVYTLESCSGPPRAQGALEKPQQLERWRLRLKRFHPISSLVHQLHILNDPHSSSPSSSTLEHSQSPSFRMNLLGWIGGSLAGAMRVGGQEVIRERWDSVVESSLVSQEVGLDPPGSDSEDGGEQYEWEKRLVGLKMACAILPDWTRLTLA